MAAEVQPLSALIGLWGELRLKGSIVYKIRLVVRPTLHLNNVAYN